MGLKRGIIYVLVANIINLIMSLFSGFALPKLLSVESYASIKLFQLYIAYVGVLHFGFVDGMYLNYGGKNVDKINKSEVLSELKTFKIFQLYVTILAVIISLIFRNTMLLFCSLVILPINTGEYIRALYQAIGQFKKYSRFTNISTVLIFIINIILLLIVKSDNYYIYIISYVLAYIIYWVIIEIENRKIFYEKKSKLDIKYVFSNIKTGFFLMVGNFCNIIFTSIDRIFVQNLMGSIKFAFYSFAVSIENLMSVFITPISTVMYNYLCNNREKEKVLQIKKIILICSTIIIAVIFPAKFIVDMWITKYQEATTVLFLLFAAQFVSIIVRCVHINLYKAEKKQNRYFKIMLLTVLISIVLNFVLYYIYNSIEMIALATLMTNIIWFIIGEVDFKEYKLQPREYIHMILIIILFLLCGKIKNAILGCLIYIFISIILIFILLRKDFIYCLGQIKYYFKKFIKK